MDRHSIFTALGAILAVIVLACRGDLTAVQEETPEIVPIELSAAETLPPDVLDFPLAGESRVFAVELASGNYLEVEAEQHEVDLALTLLAPDGSAILTVDSLNGPAGVETLGAVATAAGRHGLRVAAFPGQPAGEVRLHRVATRPANEADQRFAEVLARHVQTPAEGGPAERRRLLVERRRQLERLDGLDRPLLRARLERALGLLWLQEGRVRQALRHFERALPAIRDESSDWELSALLNDTGYAARLSGEPELARASFEESLRRADVVEYDPPAATALNNLGVLSESLGQLEEALRFYDLAVVRWRRLGSLRSLGTTLPTGLTYLSLGLSGEARDHFRQALDLRRQTGDRKGEAKTLAAVGWASSLEGDHQCALDLYDQALVLRRAIGDRRGEAATLDQRATALRALGRRREALADFEHALTLLRESGNRVSEAHVLANLGEVLLELDRSAEALDRHLEALALFQAIGDYKGEARALIGLATVQHQRGHLAAARRHHERALELVESIRSRLQSAAFRTSYVAARFDAYSTYVDLLLELDAVEPNAGHAVDAFEAVERARARSLREGLGGSRSWWNRAAAELRAEEQRLRNRINLLDNRRFSLLEAAAGEDELEKIEAEIEELVREYEKLEGRLRQSAGPQDAPPRALTLEEVQAALDPGTTLLAYHLGEREVVWLVQQDRFLLRPLTDVGGTSSETPLGDTTEVLAVRTRTALARSAGVGRLSQAKAEVAVLAERVLGPVIAELVLPPLTPPDGTVGQVVIVADGALATVPFAVLLQEHEVVHLPSASVLPLLRREREPPGGLLAMVADPIFSAKDPRLAASSDSAGSVVDDEDLKLVARDMESDLLRRLPHAGVEAEAILSLVDERTEDPSQRLKKVGPDASRDLVLGGDLAGYRIVHFATHGWIDDRHPTLSGLVLSRFDATGRPRQGFLRVHEIERLELAADLVVLSACRTALGDTVRGEGVVGMAHAFFRAGARRLVVSYWRVDDRATAALMERFYRHLLLDGLSAAAALAEAQRWMRTETRWRAPTGARSRCRATGGSVPHRAKAPGLRRAGCACLRRPEADRPIRPPLPPRERVGVRVDTGAGTYLSQNRRSVRLCRGALDLGKILVPPTYLGQMLGVSGLRAGLRHGGQ